MRKLFIILILMTFVAAPVFAANAEWFDETELGAIVDLPSIFIKKGNHNLGGEAVLFDLFSEWKEGSAVYVKYSYTGCFLLCDN